MPLNPELLWRRRRYWRAVRWLTAGLLGLWFVAGFGLVYFARSLPFAFFGWPFSFWWAAQGALLVFLLLVAGFQVATRQLDRVHDLDEHD